MSTGPSTAWSIDGDVVPEGWTAELRQALEGLRQGSLLEDPPITYYADPAHPLTITTTEWARGRESPGPISSRSRRPPWGIVTTQTCDLIEEGRPKRPWLQLSPVYHFKCPDGTATRIRRGEEFQYLFPVSTLPECANGLWVADLRLTVSIEKGWVLGKRTQGAFKSNTEYLGFAQRMAELITRFAYPRRLQEVFLAPLMTKMRVLEETYAGRSGILEVRYACGRDQDDPDTVEPVFLSERALDGDVMADLTDWWVRTFNESGSTDGLVVLSPRFATYGGKDCIDPREYESLQIPEWPTVEAGPEGPSPPAPSVGH